MCTLVADTHFRERTTKWRTLQLAYHGKRRKTDTSAKITERQFSDSREIEQDHVAIWVEFDMTHLMTRWHQQLRCRYTIGTISVPKLTKTMGSSYRILREILGDIKLRQKQSRGFHLFPKLLDQSRYGRGRAVNSVNGYMLMINRQYQPRLDFVYTLTCVSWSQRWLSGLNTISPETSNDFRRPATVIWHKISINDQKKISSLRGKIYINKDSIRKSLWHSRKKNPYCAKF